MVPTIYLQINHIKNYLQLNCFMYYLYWKLLMNSFFLIYLRYTLFPLTLLIQYEHRSYQCYHNYLVLQLQLFMIDNQKK
jgi:hypothetical protein